MTTTATLGHNAGGHLATQELSLTADRSTLALCVDVLGHLELRVDGRTVEVPGARRRALLALLALEAGHNVSAERLVDCLWPDEAPDNAMQALYNHISRLRGHLGALGGRLQRHGAGYRLHLEPYELDADAARRLAQSVGATSSPASAAAAARAALDLWRGPALEEFKILPALEAESVGLDELRLRLVDSLMEAQLALGDRAVVVEATAAAAASPLRERTALLHIRALAADGRTAEAMRAAQAFRRRLAEEAGLDPGVDLAALEQLVASGGIGTAATTLGSMGTAVRLVRPDGPLVGRQHDRAEVLRLLGTNATVTITGPGGVGKTRLALDVAADPAAAPHVPGRGTGDVVVVDLSAVDRPERVCQAVVSTLGLRVSGTVHPADVAEALGDRDLLIVLDNCEHLPDACRDLIVTVRRAAPGARFLATSRVTLHVPGEHVVRLQPLPVPRDDTDLGALRRQPVVRAFIEHARLRRAGFELAAEDVPDLMDVLRRLDGLPLGIELAARQVAVMPLRDVRHRLDRVLDLTIGMPGDDRQSTLRATIDSSYRLLGDAEQQLLRALAPFPGGVDLSTVEALAATLGAPGDPVDLLHRLVDTSLVVANASTGRYRLLFTVRAFLLDELRNAGDLDDAEELFLDRCLEICTELGAAFLGPDEPQADRRLRAELDNLRAARDLAVTHGRDDVRVGITVELDDAFNWRDLRELWTWSLELAADSGLEKHPDRAAILGFAADGARLMGDLDLALDLADRSFAAAGPDPDPRQVQRAGSARACVAHYRGDFAQARTTWLRSARGRNGDESGGFVASAALATSYGGDPDLAQELLGRAHALIEKSQCPSHAAFAAYVEGEVRATTRVEESVAFYLEAIDSARRVGSTFVEGVASVALASARARIGDVAGAAAGFVHLIDLWRRTGQTTQLWTTARNAAGLLADVGSARMAALLLICADAAPGAAAVDPQIAQFSGRTYTRLSDLVDDAELSDLRAEATRIGAAGVLDQAAAQLRELVSESGRIG